jgi:[protein-PII] uridylyltransferase
MTMRVARRLGLDGSSTQVLRKVIEHHLLMASVSQRRDLDDLAVIRQFARQIENTETLCLLTLHTFADAQATSDKLWNGFKDSLLWTLHHKAMRLLTGGSEFVRGEEKQREQLLAEVHELLPPSISEEELVAHFGTLPPRYFQISSAREILNDLVLAHRFMRQQISEAEEALIPVVNWHNEPDRGYNVVKICTWDRAGLFCKITGSFSAAALNILSAQIFTRNDGIVLDTFFVTDARTGHLAGPEERAKFETVLNKALSVEEVEFQPLIARQKISRPLYQAYAGERIPTQIRIDNEVSETRTLIEIETEDRIGLLYAISKALSELEMDISAAKISTEKGAAIDTFYVHEIEGGKITAPERLRAIERKLRHAIQALER